MRRLSAHGATVLVTLGFALMVAWTLGWGRGDLSALRPREAAFARPGAYAPPEVPAPLPDGPPDRDEQVNIRVYEAANRGVVNITNSAGGDRFRDEGDGGTGSGFVLDKTGLILTNYHVIAGAETLEVTLADSSTHPAVVIGSDPSNDVAVVRIEAPKGGLTPLSLGDSSTMKVGQKVLAIGNPFGLQRTLTTGIVSSLDRTIRAKNGRAIKGIIQTDAAINPGNSGGPLLNARGEVVGITTAILSPVGQSAGIGFAVPINAIKRILGPLVETGRVVRADLGLRQAYATDQGIYILDLVEGGPADLAGLKPLEVVIERYGRFYRRRPDPDSADRILSVDGKPVRTVEDLLGEIEAHAPGEVVSILVARGDRERSVKVTLGKSDER